jgi:hypothetical protein
MDWLAGMLRSSDLLLVPLEWLKEKARSRYPRADVSLDMLVRQIATDNRFTLVKSVSDVKKSRRLCVYSGDEEGYPENFSGLKVMLRERARDRKQAIRFLIVKADRTYEILKRAWDERPRGEEDVEDRLLEALAKTQKLQRELRSALAREGASGGRHTGRDRSS